MPYQASNFVTPPFAGYTSGHSTFSRATAEALAGKNAAAPGPSHSSSATGAERRTAAPISTATVPSVRRISRSSSVSGTDRDGDRLTISTPKPATDSRRRLLHCARHDAGPAPCASPASMRHARITSLRPCRGPVGRRWSECDRRSRHRSRSSARRSTHRSAYRGARVPSR